MKIGNFLLAVCPAAFLAVVLSAGLGCSDSSPDSDKSARSPTVVEATIPEKAPPRDALPAARTETYEHTDGDRVTRVPVRTYPARNDGDSSPKDLDYPPDSRPFRTVLETENLIVARFPEYTQWSRFSANGYAVLDKPSGETVLIDPGIGSVRMMRFWVKRQKAKVAAIVATHGHIDHTGGVRALKQAYPKAVFAVPEADADWMRTPDPEHFAGIRAPLPPPPDRTLRDGDALAFGNLALDVVATPGHTVGSVCLSLPEEHLLFSGDTLLYRSIGRTDLPHALSQAELLVSIKRNLGAFDDETRVLPGHGRKTTLGDERRQNRYLLSNLEKKRPPKTEKRTP